MSIEITHVKYSGTSKTHESIVEYKWKNQQTGNVASSTKPVLVAWVEGNGAAYVGANTQQVEVKAVRPSGAPAYLRTHADGKPTNNLLSLPTF